MQSDADHHQTSDAAFPSKSMTLNGFWRFIVCVVQVVDGKWGCWSGQAPPDLYTCSTSQDLDAHLLKGLTDHHPTPLDTLPVGAVNVVSTAQNTDCLLQARYTTTHRMHLFRNH